MLEEVDVIATIAVKDLPAAKDFYEGTLGLRRDVSEEPDALTYKCGRSSLLVYKSAYAGTNEATAATWEVDDVERAVQVLKDKGVRFERYDMPGMEREGDVHIGGKTKAAWFKDPDGNILAIVGRR